MLLTWQQPSLRGLLNSVQQPQVSSQPVLFLCMLSSSLFLSFCCNSLGSLLFFLAAALRRFFSLFPCFFSAANFGSSLRFACSTCTVSSQPVLSLLCCFLQLVPFLAATLLAACSFLAAASLSSLSGRLLWAANLAAFATCSFLLAAAALFPACSILSSSCSRFPACSFFSCCSLPSLFPFF